MKEALKQIFFKVRGIAVTLDYKAIIIPGILLSFELLIQALKKKKKEKTYKDAMYAFSKIGVK